MFPSKHSDLEMVRKINITPGISIDEIKLVATKLVIVRNQKIGYDKVVEMTIVITSS